MDEQNHIARGLAFWGTGDPRLSVEHPPLINLISTLPLLTLPHIALPTDDPSWNTPNGWYAFADLLLWQYNHDVTRMVFLARLPIVWLTLGLALTCFHFARQLWQSRTAGLFAGLFVLFDPNIIAHGRYTTTDLGSTAFILLATYLLWRQWQKPSNGRWAYTVLGLGLAFASKLSSLTFVFIWGGLAILPLYPENNWRMVLKRVWQFGLAGVGSIGVVWAIFGFEWGTFRFHTDALLPLNSYRGPMPTFWAGIEQIAGVSGGGRPSFLLGQYSETGFRAYFPIAFAVKTPLPVLILLFIAILVLVSKPATRSRALFLLIPALLYFFISVQSALNIGYRHLLPILPFIHILNTGFLSSLFSARSKLFTIRYSLFTVLLLCSDFLIHPYYLSYFNIAAGGPQNGANILIDSNIDWGQDLLRLKQWMIDHDVDEVKLGWFGTADPAYYGIKNQPMPGLGRQAYFSLWYPPPFNPENPEPGIYAISVSNLWESHWATKITYPWFRARQPDDRIGYSILIYEVP